MSALSGEGALPWKLWAPGPRKVTQRVAGPEGNRPALTGGLGWVTPVTSIQWKRRAVLGTGRKIGGRGTRGLEGGYIRNSAPKSFEDPRNSVILLGGVVGSAVGAPVPGVPVQGFRSFPGVAPGKTARLPGKGNRICQPGETADLARRVWPSRIVEEACQTWLFLSVHCCF